MFCYYEKCEHYKSAEKYGIKCYYEPQCWRGRLDTMFLIFGIMIGRFKKLVKHSS